MGEFEEFAEALLDQISVEIDEEKEIAKLSEKIDEDKEFPNQFIGCLLYTSPSPRDRG